MGLEVKWLWIKPVNKVLDSCTKRHCRGSSVWRCGCERELSRGQGGSGRSQRVAGGGRVHDRGQCGGGGGQRVSGSGLVREQDGIGRGH